MKLKVFVDANLSLKVYRPLHPKRVIMAAAHFTTTPCKPCTVPKVQGKPHFSARLNTLRAPKVRALRIKGRFMYAIFFAAFWWIIFVSQVYLLQVWNSLFPFGFRCTIFRVHSKQRVKTNTWRASKNTQSLLASWNAALITSLVCVNVDHTI